MVRRRIAAGVALVFVVIIVLVINGCLKSQKQQSLKDYNREVGQLAAESDTQVSKPLFAALAGASGKSALDVEVQIDQLRRRGTQTRRTRRGAQGPGRNGGRTARAAARLPPPRRRHDEARRARADRARRQEQAGEHRTGGRHGDLPGLGRDLLPARRAADRADAFLSGIKGLSTTPTRFLANVGWLDPNTTFSRLTGQAAGSSTTGQAVTGNHGSALKTVSVGTNTLAPEPTLNHVSGGGNPTFTVQVENSGEFPETNVKVDIVVTAGGKQYKASHVIEKTEPGKAVNVEIPVTGIPLGAAAKVQVNIEGVPGENDLENNKNTFLVIFGA